MWLTRLHIYAKCVTLNRVLFYVFVRVRLRVGLPARVDKPTSPNETELRFLTGSLVTRFAM